jgi:hypothetical protein
MGFRNSRKSVKAKKFFKLVVVTAGGCFRDIIPKKAGKKPSIREIKDARGIRVIPMESFYTWNDDEDTLCFETEERNPEPPPSPNTMVHSDRPLDEGWEPGSPQSSTTSMESMGLPDGAYISARERMDRQENSLYLELTHQQLCISPLSKPLKILCAGPGTTVWAAQMAEKYPNAEVRCLDPNPYPGFMPRNCTVERANIDEYRGSREWDFIYVRDSLVITHWPYFVDNLWALAKIGGWVEIVDIERVGPICTCGEFINARTGLTCGRCEFMPPGDDRASTMAEAGFQFVRKAITSGNGRLRERYQLYCVSIAAQVIPIVGVPQAF